MPTLPTDFRNQLPCAMPVLVHLFSPLPLLDEVIPRLVEVPQKDGHDEKQLTA